MNIKPILAFLSFILFASCQKELDVVNFETIATTPVESEPLVVESESIPEDKTRADWTGKWSSLSDMINPAQVVIKRNGGINNVKVELYTFADQDNRPSLTLRGYVIPSINKLVLYTQATNIRRYRGEATIVSNVPNLKVKFKIEQTQGLTAPFTWTSKYITPSFLNDDAGDLPYVYLRKVQ